MNKEIRCSSCNKKIINSIGSTIFKCPVCRKEDIIRCYHCRKIGARYTCPSCGFSGPN